MEIEVAIHEAREPVAVMSIKGNIDASNYVEVINQAQEIYKRPVHNLLLDLSEVPFISSAGLVAIHKISLIYSGGQQEVQQEGKETRPDFTHNANARKRVKLLRPQPGVDKTLEMAGLKLFFKVFDDLESAVQSF